MIEIVKWSECFESADTRKRQRLGWFLSPSGCDSKGFRKLTRMGSEGVTALGVFQALCQAMATQSIDSRKAGMFQNSDGSPMELEDILEISRLTGMEVADYRQAIGRLVACGWICLHKPLETEQYASHLPPICQSSPSFVQGEGEGQGKEKGEGLPAVAVPPLFETWNSIGSLPKIQEFSAKRRKALAERMKSPFFVDNWRAAIGKITESKFLTGQNDRGWRANIDWFLRPDTVTRIMEGEFNNKAIQGSFKGLQEDIEMPIHES